MNTPTTEELIDALRGTLPVIDDAELDARRRAEEHPDPTFQGKWTDVARRFKDQADDIRRLGILIPRSPEPPNL